MIKNNRTICAGLSIVMASVILILNGCATNAITTEIPFGTMVDVGPLSVATNKLNQGELLLTVLLTSDEEFQTEIRMRRSKVGFDYGQNSSASDKTLYSKYQIDNPRRTLESDEPNEFIIRLENRHEVSRAFYTIIYLGIKSDQGAWNFDIRVEDKDMFSDIEYLRTINSTNYWHPRIIQENWDKYLRHIGE